MNRSRAALFALALTAPLLIAGCGGSTSADDSTAAGDSALTPDQREGAQAGLAVGIAALDFLTEFEKGCMSDWAATLTDADLRQWTLEPLPQTAIDGLDLATATCQRESATTAAVDGLVAQGLTPSMASCARDYMDSLSSEAYAALVIRGGQPEAIQAYSDAVGACQAAG